MWVRGWWLHWSAHTLRIPRFDHPGSLEAPSAFDRWRIPPAHTARVSADVGENRYAFSFSFSLMLICCCPCLSLGRKLCLPDVSQRIPQRIGHHKKPIFVDTVSGRICLRIQLHNLKTVSVRIPSAYSRPRPSTFTRGFWRTPIWYS